MTLKKILSLFILVGVCLSTILGSNPPAAVNAQSAPQQTAVQMDVPYITQTGNKDIIGDKSGYDINGWGCGIASLAMIFRYYGLDTDASRLNTALTKNDAFSGAELAWYNRDAFPKASGGFIKAVERAFVSSSDSQLDRVNQSLTDHQPVITFLHTYIENPKTHKMETDKSHFVVLTGRTEDGHYLINDPAKASSATGKSIPLENNVIGAALSSADEFIFVTRDANSPTNGILVSQELAQSYSNWFGSKGLLGNPKAATKNLAIPYVGVWQEFQNGAIYGVKDKQPSVIFGPVWHKLVNEGGVEKLGMPKRSIQYYLRGASITYQADFDRASIIWNTADAGTQSQLLTQDNSLKTEFFDNPSFDGQPAYTMYSPQIAQNWESGPADPSVKPEHFSVRYSGKIKVGMWPGWWYNFRHTVGGGSLRILVDGKEISANTSFLNHGDHSIVVEFSKTTNPAQLGVTWTAWPEVRDPGAAVPHSPSWVGKVNAAEPDIWAAPLTSLPALSSNAPPSDPPDPGEPPTEEAPLPSGGTPTQIVQTLFEALNNNDIEAAGNTLLPSDRLLGKPLLQLVDSLRQKQGIKVVFEEMDYQVSSQEDGHAIVLASGQVKLYNAENDLTGSDYFDLHIPLDYSDNHWVISLDVAKIIDLINKTIAAQP